MNPAGTATGGGTGAADPRDGGIPARYWEAAVGYLRDLPAGAEVLLVCHVNPDGDALGSMLGVGLGLRRLGVPVRATFPAPYTLTPPFDTLPGVDLLGDPAQAPAAPDLLLCFDAASEGRLGELADRLATAGASVVLDHHASNPGFGTVPLVDPGAAATAVVAARLLERLGVPLDAQIAECLYVALSTDTGSFKFDLTTPAVHELAARLLGTGIRPAEIARRLFDARPFGAMKLYGDVLARATLEPEAARGAGLVWSYATTADLDRYAQGRHVLEGLIDAVRVAEEADVACVLKQVVPGQWNVSLRSKGAVDVARVAVDLGGGGHRLAAGCTVPGDLATAIGVIRAAL